MVGQLISLAWMIVAALGTDEPEKGCVNHPASYCPVPDKETSFCLCQRIETDTTVICCNIHTEFELKESLSCACELYKLNYYLAGPLPLHQKIDLSMMFTNLIKGVFLVV